jgi:hypothetical protein
MMQIIIPTRGRTTQQFTLQSLPREWLKRTTFVCPKLEAVRLAHLYPDVEIVVEPRPGMKIAQVRQWMVQTWHQYGYDKILMLDDDLTFAIRVSAEGTSLRTIWGEELGAEIRRLEDKLGPEFPHVGFAPRLYNNHADAGWNAPERPQRMMYTLGYYLPVVKECRCDLVDLREDFCVTLQLLLKGYPNAVWNTTVADNRETNGAGGCSTYRTDEMSEAEAWKLAALFPGYVSVRWHAYKTSASRLEVRVDWKKALEDGQRMRCSNAKRPVAEATSLPQS